MIVGIYPGSFNPPTTAHLAIAEAARGAYHLDRVVLSVSRSALGKEQVERPVLNHRIEVLEAVASRHRWLTVDVTDRQLLVDIAEGFDVLVVGADKWRQIQDPVWYENDLALRDAALARLPPLAVVPRDGIAAPPALTLHLDRSLVADISSTRARAGAVECMVPEAQDFARRTGAWINPDRYEAWLNTTT